MQNHNDAAKVRFFSPGISLTAILSGLGLRWILPLHFGVKVSEELRYLVGAMMTLGAIVIFGTWPSSLKKPIGSKNSAKTYRKYKQELDKARTTPPDLLLATARGFYRFNEKEIPFAETRAFYSPVDVMNYTSRRLDYHDRAPDCRERSRICSGKTQFIERVALFVDGSYRHDVRHDIPDRSVLQQVQSMLLMH